MAVNHNPITPRLFAEFTLSEGECAQCDIENPLLIAKPLLTLTAYRDCSSNVIMGQLMGSLVWHE